MKMFVQMMGILGAILFLIGAAMRIFQTNMILHASPVAWWRAGVFCILLGILYGLVEIRNGLTKA